ncbi:MAG: restriction endonuclease subunit S [Gammaproteobacteria bacterium]|nr:restriction endonuclease subunit S [Gammaproteobacteria bacterium]MCF6229770.1 restriction endonuclease subunit S [Gammaproteobacteria bacterium]
MISLSEIADISAGYSFRGKIEEQAGTGIHAIQMKDVSEESGLNHDTVVETSLPSKRTPDWLQAGDILFIARGSRIFATLYDGVFKAAIASPHFFVIRMTNQNALPEFIAWQLNQSPARRYFDKEAEGSVAKSVKRTSLDKTPISLPNLQRQQTILKLHKNIHEQKLIHRELINNADKLMKDVALNLEGQQ